ncbi:MAG: fumarylacetoacetate hydrolase family protein [Desulfuromonadia bacterium]
MGEAVMTTGTRYRIGKILCIGRNYVDHIHELGNERPEAPVIFSKPATAVISTGETVRIPPYSRECHHEVELALLIGALGRNTPEDESWRLIAGYGVAIDLTLRDVQQRLKEKGLPWEIAKGFDTSCPLSPFVPPDSIDPSDTRLRLSVNGSVRQDDTTKKMIWSIAELISYLSGIFTLEPGDVILTGTPSGVSAIRSGDRISAEIPGVVSLEVTVA